MKLATPYQCNYCTNTKGESNHWWLLWPTVPGFFKFSTWSDADADKQGVEHICSEACAVKALSKWMSLQK